jgi:hypothetical protein
MMTLKKYGSRMSLRLSPDSKAYWDNYSTSLHKKTLRLIEGFK